MLAGGLDQRALGVHADGNRNYSTHTIAIAGERPLAARRHRQARSGNLAALMFFMSLPVVVVVFSRGNRLYNGGVHPRLCRSPAFPWCSTNSIPLFSKQYRRMQHKQNANAPGHVLSERERAVSSTTEQEEVNTLKSGIQQRSHSCQRGNASICL